MDVSIELVRILGRDDIPLQKRVNLAKNSFISHHLPALPKEQVLESKEEISLKWLCALIRNVTSLDVALLALRECLTSKRIKYYKLLYISPGTRTNLVSSLCSIDSVIPEENRVRAECCLSLLEIPLFQQHFNSSPADYAALVGSLLKCLRHVENDYFPDMCQTFSSSFSAYVKKFLLNSNFQKYFFMEILSPLSLLFEAERLPSMCPGSFKELKKCTQLTLFPPMEREERQASIDRLFISLIQGNEDVAVVDAYLFLHLHSVYTTVDLKEFLYILRVTFRAFVASRPRDFEQHCQVFLIICYLLGLKPIIRDDCPSFSFDVKGFYSLPAISKPKKNVSYKCLPVLIGTLNEGNVNLNVEIGGHSFISWLKGMCECLILKDVIVDELAVLVLTCLSDMDPSILDTHSNKVLGPIMLRRSIKNGVASKKQLQFYSDFLQSLLNSSIKLHRTQKLASRILSSVKEELSHDPSLASGMTVREILPETFCTNFGESMQLLVVSQSLAMLRTLMFHLTEDCVVPMENGQSGPPVVLLLQATKCLLCAFLVGYKAIDPNIPEVQAQKFSLMMAELGSTLGRLGRTLLLEKHNPDTIGAFLELTHCWGDLQLLLMFYRLDKQLEDASSVPDFTQAPSVTPHKLCGNTTRKSVGSSTDFSCLHSYLSEGEWSHLVERIVNFGDESCKETLDELVIQKMKMLLLFEPDIMSDNIRCCVQHLLSRACDSERALALLVENEAIVTPVLDDDGVNKLMALIVGKTAFGEPSFLKAFHDNPVVAPVATVSLLKKIGETALYTDDKAKSSRKRRLSEHEDEVNPCAKRQRGRHLAHCIFQSVAKTPLSMADLSNCDVPSSDGMKELRGDSLLKLLEEISSALSEYLGSDCKMSKTLSHEKSVISFSALKNLIHLLNSLPLPNFGSDLRIVVSLCVIGLLITTREHHQPSDEVILAEIALSKVLLLSMKASDVTKGLSNHLNIGDFLVWYISEKGNILLIEHKSEELDTLQQQIMKEMVEVAMSSPSGLKQLKPVVKALKTKLKEEGTPMLYGLSSTLMAALAKKCGKSSSATPAVKQKCHKYCYSIAVSTLNGVNFDPTSITKETLECFCLILQIIIPAKDQKRLNKMGEYLRDLFREVKQRLGINYVDGPQTNPLPAPECADGGSRDDSYYVNFLEKLLRCRMYFKDKLSSTFAWDVWKIFIKYIPFVDKKTFLNAIKTLYQCANKMEFVLMAKDLVDKLGNLDMKLPGLSKFHHYMLFWISLAQVNLNKGLDVVRQEALKTATPIFLSFTRNWGNSSVSAESVTEIAVTLLEFVRVLLKNQNVIHLNSSIGLAFGLMSSALGYMMSSDAPSTGKMLTSPATVNRDIIGFQRIFMSCTSTLLALVTHQPENLMDRIASFLQLLGAMFQVVVNHGNVDQNPAGSSQGGSYSQKLPVVIKCAMSLEWICNALVKYRKEHVRISPYFIANLVRHLEMNPVHPSVKTHLHNCIYVFIYFCDPSGMTYLQHALSAGSREIFRSILENYKKFYRFKGKL